MPFSAQTLYRFILCPGMLLSLTALGCGGGGGSSSAPVPPKPALISTFQTDHSEVTQGQSAILSWQLDATVTTLTLDGATVSPNPGSRTVVPRWRQVYNLVATDAAGRSETRSVTVAAKGLDLLAGHPGGFGTLDGQGAQARFGLLGPSAVDSAGNLYVADQLFSVIRRITPDGAVTTVAGVAGMAGYRDGQASQALFSSISGLAMAADGTLFVNDHDNGWIRTLSPAGQVQSFAAVDSGGSGYLREDLALDAQGNLYVPDFFGNQVCKITPQGQVSVFLTGITYPRAVSILASGWVVVCGAMGDVVGVAADGTRTALSWSLAAPNPNGKTLVYPVKSIIQNPSGTLYLGSLGSVYQVPAGGGAATLLWAGEDDQFAGGGAAALAWCSQGFLYVIRVGIGGTVGKLVPGQPLETLAGMSQGSGWRDGPGAQALFQGPSQQSVTFGPTGIAMDPGGYAVVADLGNRTFRTVARDGAVATLTNPGTDVTVGTVFKDWMGFCIDPGRKLRFLSGQALASWDLTTGQVAIVAGQSAFSPGQVNGPLASARFDLPMAVAVGADGSAYIADHAWGGATTSIRKVASGQVSTLAGGYGGQADGPGAQAGFAGPYGMAADAAGTVYVADYAAHTIRKITAAGVVTTLAGTFSLAGHRDGPAAQALFNFPMALALDGLGSLYVADQSNHAIRKIAPDGTVTTIVGGPDRIGIRPGTLAAGSLSWPQGLALTVQGDLLVTCGGAVLQVTAP